MRMLRDHGSDLWPPSAVCSLLDPPPAAARTYADMSLFCSRCPLFEDPLEVARACDMLGIDADAAARSNAIAAKIRMWEADARVVEVLRKRPPRPGEEAAVASLS